MVCGNHDSAVALQHYPSGHITVDKKFRYASTHFRRRRKCRIHANVIRNQVQLHILLRFIYKHHRRQSLSHLTLGFIYINVLDIDRSIEFYGFLLQKKVYIEEFSLKIDENSLRLPMTKVTPSFLCKSKFFYWLILPTFI